MDNLKFIRNLSWNGIFKTWQDNEGQNPAWQEFARRERGWNSWQEWRTYQSSIINADQKKWTLYEIQNPNEVIPNFLIGPFRGWQAHFKQEERYTHSFADLIASKKEWTEQNIGITLKKDDFPQPTQFIGIFLKDKNKIMLYEGHHRAAAIALAVAQSQPISFKINPNIALTKFEKVDEKLIKRTMEIGTQNPNKK